MQASLEASAAPAVIGAPSGGWPLAAYAQARRFGCFPFAAGLEREGVARATLFRTGFTMNPMPYMVGG